MEICQVLIKLAATWEGIAAMAELEKEARLYAANKSCHCISEDAEGITCNMTLVFGFD